MHSAWLGGAGAPQSTVEAATEVEMEQVRNVQWREQQSRAVLGSADAIPARSRVLPFPLSELGKQLELCCLGAASFLPHIPASGPSAIVFE